MRGSLSIAFAWVAAGLLVGSACSSDSKSPNPTDVSGDAGESASGGSPDQPRGGSAGKGGTGGSGAAGTAAGGEGGGCPDCPSGFCLDDGTCVDCLPSRDECADGTYCTDDNECAPGCKADGRGCASGQCTDDHNCEACIDDSECVAPLLCNSGTCGAACTASDQGTERGCADGLTCCDLHCSELEVDSRNCGSCGHACDAGQFCGVDCAPDGSGGAGGASGVSCAACHDTTIANVCAVSRVIVILDSDRNQSDGNRIPGRAAGNALRTQCASAPMYIEAEQASLEALNITSGRPVSGGGELLVVAGGPFFQTLEGYLEDERIAPLYWYVGPNGDYSEYRRSADDEPVVHLPVAGDHDSHDYFIVQFMRDPTSGSLALNLQGLWLSGTVAAAYQVQQFLADLTIADQAWYAYEWTDKDGDKAPDADEITLVDSGT